MDLPALDPIAVFDIQDKIWVRNNTQHFLIFGPSFQVYGIKIVHFSEKESQQSKATSNSQFYSTTSWLPLSICMERLSNGSVRAYNINDPSEKPTDLVNFSTF